MQRSGAAWRLPAPARAVVTPVPIAIWMVITAHFAATPDRPEYDEVMLDNLTSASTCAKMKELFEDTGPDWRLTVECREAWKMKQ